MLDLFVFVFDQVLLLLRLKFQEDPEMVFEAQRYVTSLSSNSNCLVNIVLLSSSSLAVLFC